MNYLLFICGDETPNPEAEPVLQRETPHWVDEMDGRGVRLVGRPLQARRTAATVRVRDGETLVTDGPYSESKEWVAGFDIISCADLDEAIEVAAKHPMAWYHQIEIRPFWDGFEMGANGEQYARGADPDKKAFLMLMFIDGIAGEPEDEASILQEGIAWAKQLAARGKQVLGYPLQHKDTATTVTVRNGETLISDGPFVETHEFIGGLDIVYCENRDEAIEIAAAHPLARHHAVEVREIWE